MITLEEFKRFAKENEYFNRINWVWVDNYLEEMYDLSKQQCDEYQKQNLHWLTDSKFQGGDYNNNYLEEHCSLLVKHGYDYEYGDEFLILNNQLICACCCVQATIPDQVGYCNECYKTEVEDITGGYCE